MRIAEGKVKGLEKRVKLSYYKDLWGEAKNEIK